MRTKLKDMICYRLDGELKTKLLEKLDKEQLSLSSFHRCIVKAILVDTRRILNMLEPIKKGSVC
jgi:hypothetical protein